MVKGSNHSSPKAEDCWLESVPPTQFTFTNKIGKTCLKRK